IPKQVATAANGVGARALECQKGVDMSDDNKRNLLFFESISVRELYDKMNEWQTVNRKRLHSISIQKDGDVFCCIALTNPAEVTIVQGSDTAYVSGGALWVQIK